jgi:hypothetical protein
MKNILIGKRHIQEDFSTNLSLILSIFTALKLLTEGAIATFSLANGDEGGFCRSN